jgi:hypothetical protein
MTDLKSGGNSAIECGNITIFPDPNNPSVPLKAIIKLHQEAEGIYSATFKIESATTVGEILSKLAKKLKAPVSKFTLNAASKSDNSQSKLS